MATPKIVLFYVFTPLADPDAIRVWQRDLGEALGLRGRLLISKDGVNGTLGGDLLALKKWARSFRSYAPFKNADIKWSEGTGVDADGRSVDFPKLSVKVRDEIVSFGAPGELRVDENGVIGGGTRLTPEELHELMGERGDEVVFFDGRNALEAQIGRFRGAVVPDTETTRDFVQLLDSGAYDDLKGKPVVTYCTGGIRCEILSAAMRDRGFGEVYQIDGGIVKYGEAFGNDGLWEGSLAVFDGREALDFAPDAAVIGRCRVCAAPSNTVTNCSDPSCKHRFVVCSAHAGSPCAEHAAA